MPTPSATNAPSPDAVRPDAIDSDAAATEDESNDCGVDKVLPPDANIAERLRQTAARHPRQTAVRVPSMRRGQIAGWQSKTFGQLDAEADAVARGLVEMGAGPGKRLLLAVRPDVDFLSIVFGLFRSRATAVLIDPGMGRQAVLDCIEQVRPDGVVGIPLAHIMRRLKRDAFRSSRINVCVGRRLPGMGRRYRSLLVGGHRSAVAIGRTTPTDPAAIVFTSGSTGPPKGVCYEHGMFDAQWQLIRDEYNIPPGTVDVACFPLFGLFNVAMGVTTIWPAIDFSRPATADLDHLTEVMQQADQCFASPAIWDKLATAAADGKPALPLRRALSAGAPVKPATLAAVRSLLPEDAEFHTPYGATESLPGCTIESREVLDETAAETLDGAGTCVGRPFAGVDVRVIRRPTRPVRQIVETEEAGIGEIGEIIIRSAAVTREYLNRPDATAATKIDHGDGTRWHRVGDVGYFDAEGRLWFCGRISHIVETDEGPLYPVCLEPLVKPPIGLGRVAIVGIERPGRTVPVVVAEQSKVESAQTPDGRRPTAADRRQSLARSMQHPRLSAIRHAAIVSTPLPVDARHNAKLRREQIAAELSWDDVFELPAIDAGHDGDALGKTASS